MAKFILWAGSKERLLPQIESYMLPYIGSCENYFEPFLGGGSNLIQVLTKFKHLKCYANDANALLINTWQVLQKYPNELAEEIEEADTVWKDLALNFSTDYKEEEYKTLFLHERAKLNRMIATGATGLPLAVSFLIINHMGYNGLFRVNAKGLCNTPAGTYHVFPTKKELLQLSELIKNVTFTCMDFRHFLTEPFCQHGFIYADPPYRPLSKTANFTTYCKDGFTEEDHIELSYILIDSLNKDCRFLLHSSYSDDLDEWVKKYYNGCSIHAIGARRNINCKGNKRGKIPEAIILPEF